MNEITGKAGPSGGWIDVDTEQDLGAALEESIAELRRWSRPLQGPLRPPHEILALTGEDTTPPTMDGATALEEVAGAWTGTPAQVAFRDRVLAAHLARSRKGRRPAGRDLSPDELGRVAGTRITMRADAARAASRLLERANADLATARSAGDEDARRTVRITASSGYRGRAHQERLWKEAFVRYYDETVAARRELPGGEHGDEAVRYMIDTFRIPRRIAAPGYSNHQNGIAIDFVQERVPGHGIRNSTRPEAVWRWQNTWFFRWLTTHARFHGFTPYPPEPWHWEYRPQTPVSHEAPPADVTGWTGETSLWPATEWEDDEEGVTEDLLEPEEPGAAEELAEDFAALDELTEEDQPGEVDEFTDTGSPAYAHPTDTESYPEVSSWQLPAVPFDTTEPEVELTEPEEEAAGSDTSW